MVAPNLIGAVTINGKSAGVSLTSNVATSVLSNAASSGHAYKVNTLNVSNGSGTQANVSISYYSAAALGGTAYPIVANVTVPGQSTLNVIDRGTQYYLEENTSIGATAVTANVLVVTVSYEDIS